MGGEGFEPPKAKPAGLQPAPFDHSGIRPSWRVEKSTAGLVTGQDVRGDDKGPESGTNPGRGGLPLPRSSIPDIRAPRLDEPPSPDPSIYRTRSDT